MTPESEALLEDMLVYWPADRAILRDRLAAIEAAAEQCGRDQWLHSTAHGARQWEGLLVHFDLAEDADANTVIAAAVARALDPERVARALHFRGIACSPFRGSGVVSPSGASPLDRVVLTCQPGYHLPAADALIAALMEDPR